MEKGLIIIGANGWLGKRLVQTVVENFKDFPSLKGHEFNELRCLLHSSEDESDIKSIAPEAKIFKGDVRVKSSLEEIYKNSEGFITINAAGIIHPKRVKDFFDINFQGAVNAFELAAREGNKKFVALSSNSPLGCNAFPDHLFDENSPYNPYMNYGKSKMIMEKALRQKSKEVDLPLVLIRCPWFYGTHQPSRQTLFFQMIKNGKMPIIGTGNNLRSMSYTDNLSQGIFLSTKYTGKEDLFWIADERPYSMNEIVTTVSNVLTEDFKINVANKARKFPGLISDVAFYVDSGVQKMGLYNQKIHVLSEMNKTIACSIEKAKNVLGYRPTIELREGMRRSIEWCLSNGQSI